MARHPFSRHFKGIIAVTLTGFVVSGVLLWNHSYLLAIVALLSSWLGAAVYLLGDSSDLPGTAGDADRNVPTKDVDKPPQETQHHSVPH